MSIRVSANNMGLERTANMPTTSSFLVMGKTYLVSDRTSAASQHLMGFNANGGGDLACRLAYGDFSNNMALFGYDAGATNTFVNFASRPAITRWFFWYVQCTGTGTGLLSGGWGYCDDTSAMVTPAAITLGAANTTFNKLRIGNLPNQATDFWADARHEYIGCFNTTWSAAQLNRQRYRRAMVSTASVNFWVPAADTSSVANAVKDYSGNARDLTATATPTIEANTSNVCVNQYSRAA